MAIADNIAAERVRCIRGIGSRKRALEQMANMLAAAHPSLTASEILTGLLARERLGSTAVGGGVAVPRARSNRVDTAVGALIRLDTGVDFDADDGVAVDLIVGWLLPATATPAHRDRLARLAERLIDSSLARDLRGAADDAALYHTLVGHSAAAGAP